MRNSTTVFDHEGDAAADAAADLTREFWGAGAGWIVAGREAGPSRSSVLQVHRGDGPPESFDLDHTPASLRGIREGFAAFRPMRRWRDDSTGPIERTREHGVGGRPAPAAPVAAVALGQKRPSPEVLPHRDASIGELAAGRFDGANPGTIPGTKPDVDDGELIALGPAAPPTRSRSGALDPMVVRIALVVIALLVAIPLALVLRSSNEPTVETEVGQMPAVGDAPVDTGESSVANPVPPTSGGATAPPTADVSSAQAAAPTEAPTRAGTSEVATAPVADTAAAPVGAHLTEAQPAATVAPAVVSAIAAPATVDEEAAREVPDCSRTYTASPGDSWYRIADAAGVTPKTLMEQNRATVDTVILPGSEICLPPGAAMPAPPTTAASVTPTTAPKAAAPTTAAPKAAAPAPTTTSPPPPASSPSEVQAMIREIWPDELEERALEIAHRESKFRSSADNGWCCVGVFQLYWTAHSSWLDDYGIHSRNDLKDARKNIAAAYGLYQRSGGWGPWGG